MIKLTLVLALLFTTLVAKEKKLSIKELNKLPVIKGGGLVALRYQVLDGVHYIEAYPKKNKEDRVEFFLSPKMDYIILGQAMKAGSKERINFPLDLNRIKGQEAFIYGKGKTHYYLFTDPECPSCKEFDKVMASFKESSTFHIYFTPLKTHINAPKMIQYIMSAKTANKKFERLHDIASDKTDYKTAKISKKVKIQSKKMLKDHLALAHKMKVEFLPTLISSKGYVIPWENLKAID